MNRTFFGHPAALANLFGVELWERFSFYGMLTILGYYLYFSAADGGLGLPQHTATGLVGAYGGLVYLSTGLGTALSGVLARYYSPAHETAYFGALGGFTIAVGAAMFALSNRVSRLMPGLH